MSVSPISSFWPRNDFSATSPPFFTLQRILSYLRRRRVWAWESKMLCFSCTDANWNIQPPSSFTFEVGYFALCPEKVLVNRAHFVLVKALTLPCLAHMYVNKILSRAEGDRGILFLEGLFSFFFSSSSCSEIAFQWPLAQPFGNRSLT